MSSKTAIVTGGSSGIGLAIARKLRDQGVQVCVFDIQPPPEDFLYFPVDIRRTEEIQAAVSQIPAVDILVNNAGVYFEKYLEDTTDGEIDRMVDVNIKGTYRVTRAVIGKLKAARGCVPRGRRRLLHQHVLEIRENRKPPWASGFFHITADPQPLPPGDSPTARGR